MKTIFISYVLLLLIVLFGVICWCANAYKITQCDFAAPYKCEAVHMVGVVVPPASMLTVWVGTDK